MNGFIVNIVLPLLLLGGPFVCLSRINSC